MCAIEDAEPFDIYRVETRRARKSWECVECSRTIQAGERYHFLTGLYDGRWDSYRTCAHCQAAGRWLWEVCGGYPTTMLREELDEHWDEGFRSVPFARLIVGQRRRWHEGRDPVPDAAAVTELAQRMMQEQVAA